jgi:hypothetical protein
VNVEPWMEQVQLLDCTGVVTHTLVLLLDGTVEVRFRSGVTARVDPHRRVCFTPGVHIPGDLYEAAATLRPD